MLVATLIRHSNFSVQPLCSPCLRGGWFWRFFTTETQRTQRLHRVGAPLISILCRGSCFTLCSLCVRRLRLQHYLVNHLSQGRDLLFIGAHRDEAHIAPAIDQKRHRNGIHTVVKIIHGGIIYDKTIRQVILFLENVQVGEFFPGRGPTSVDIAGVACDTEYYQSLIFVAFMPALQSW